MGLSFGMRRCCGAPSNPAALAPNPDPRRWTLERRFVGRKGYVLQVRYLDCTNFEGVKIMAYAGDYLYRVSGDLLDPHFQERGGPIARFRPDEEGWDRACALVMSL